MRAFSGFLGPFSETYLHLLYPDLISSLGISSMIHGAASGTSEDKAKERLASRLLFGPAMSVLYYSRAEGSLLLSL